MADLVLGKRSLVAGPQGFNALGVWLPPRPNSPNKADPLAEHGFLSVKFTGGLMAVVVEGVDDPAVAAEALAAEVAKHVKTALNGAIATPDETNTSGRIPNG